jgi:hypothetical protein
MKLDDLHSLIYRTMERELAISTDDIGLDRPLHELNVDTDDWSFSVIPALDRELDIRTSVEEWSNAGTVREIALMLQKHLEAEER